MIDRLSHAWNAFTSSGTEVTYQPDMGRAFYRRPDRMWVSSTNEETIVNSIYTQIAIDVAAIPLNHVKVDANGRYQETIKSGLQDCLTVEANIDQSGRELIQDVVAHLFEHGVAAIVPVDTDLNPLSTGGYDIKSMRVGKVTTWYPKHVQVELYDDRDGQRKEIRVPKSIVAIVTNPRYDVMNAPNGTVRRLTEKLRLLDVIDKQSGSGKLDIIIQLPYVVKSETRKNQAEARRKALESQMADSKYGIGYIDGTERITQLNRPAENNLLAQVEYLTKQLYDQLGMTEDIFRGTASEAVMLNYYTRTIEPILGAIADAMIRKFLTKTARTQGQTIKYYRDPFRLVPLKDVAEIAQKFSQNEILTANEIRSILGFKASEDPNADALRNSNINTLDSGEAQAPTLADTPIDAVEEGNEQA